MVEYTFRYGPFYFSIHAEDDKDAVTKARRALEESSPDELHTQLHVDLTAGAFAGRIYVEAGELSAKDICKREEVPELVVGVPF